MGRYFNRKNWQIGLTLIFCLSGLAHATLPAAVEEPFWLATVSEDIKKKLADLDVEEILELLGEYSKLSVKPPKLPCLAKCLIINRQARALMFPSEFFGFRFVVVTSGRGVNKDLIVGEEGFFYRSTFVRPEYKQSIYHQNAYRTLPPAMVRRLVYGSGIRANDVYEKSFLPERHKVPWASSNPSLRLKYREACIWLGREPSHPALKMCPINPRKGLDILYFLRTQDIQGNLCDDKVEQGVENELNELKHIYGIYMWAGLTRGIKDEATLGRFMVNNAVKNGLRPMHPALCDLMIGLVKKRQEYLRSELSAISQNNEAFQDEILRAIYGKTTEFGLAETREDLLILDKSTAEFFPLEVVLFKNRSMDEESQETPGN